MTISQIFDSWLSSGKIPNSFYAVFCHNIANLLRCVFGYRYNAKLYVIVLAVIRKFVHCQQIFVVFKLKRTAEFFVKGRRYIKPVPVEAVVAQKRHTQLSRAYYNAFCCFVISKVAFKLFYKLGGDISRFGPAKAADRA